MPIGKMGCKYNARVIIRNNLPLFDVAPSIVESKHLTKIGPIRLA